MERDEETKCGEEEWGRSEGESGTKVGRKRQNANGRRSGEMKGTRAAKRKRGTKGREMRAKGGDDAGGTIPLQPPPPNTQHPNSHAEVHCFEMEVMGYESEAEDSPN